MYEYNSLVKERFRLVLVLAGVVCLSLDLALVRLFGDRPIYVQAQDSFMIRLNVILLIYSMFVLFPGQLIFYALAMDTEEGGDGWDRRGDRPTRLDPAPPTKGKRWRGRPKRIIAHRRPMRRVRSFSRI